MSSSLSIKSRIFIKQAKILFDRDLLEEKEEYAKGKEPIARLIQNRIAFRSETPKKSWLDFFKS